MLQVLYFIVLFIGTILLLLGISNKTKKPAKDEKTTTGEVVEFGLLCKNKKCWATKYKAEIKVGNRTYHITQYSMPWLKIGEEVKIQMTGKQKILGNERLNKKAIIQLTLGTCLLVIPLVVMYIITYI